MSESKLKYVTPADRIIQEAAKTVTVKDSAGRVLELKKPDFLWQIELPGLIEGDMGQQQLLLTMAMYLPLGYVVAIENTPVVRPRSGVMLKALWKRLDEHGYAALTTAIKEHFTEVEQESDAKNG